jgi:hypothetical protein
MPHSVIEQVSSENVKKAAHHPEVIFGQRNKLTAEGPFLDLLRLFRQELEAADRLTVVGYSFRDPHINEYVSQWLNQGQQRRLRIVDPGFGKSGVKYARSLGRFCATRLDVVAKRAEEALEVLFPATVDQGSLVSHPNGSETTPQPDTAASESTMTAKPEVEPNRESA